MNKDNFKKLIDAIALDGQIRFNMGCFVGKIVINKYDYESNIKSGNQLVSDYPANSIMEIETTEMFNCDSVGCIAGFATALSNNWNTPEWIKPLSDEDIALGISRDGTDIVKSFENESNVFLGLTQQQGRRLYYGDSDTVWKYLKFYEKDRYPSLQYLGEDDGEAENMFGIYAEWDDEDHEISLGSINYKTAIDVLTRIMNDEILIDKDSGDIRINTLEESKQEG